MDLLFGSSFILLDFFQLDLAVYPGISLISPRLRLLAQEPFPSDPVFYSIVVLVEKRGLFYHFIKTYSAVFYSIVVLVEKRGSSTIL